MASAAEIFAVKPGKCSRIFNLSFHRFRRFSQICRMQGTIWNPGNHEELFPTAKDAAVVKLEGNF
jgi:hypothetical protein